MRAFTARGSRATSIPSTIGAARIDRAHPLDHLERGRLARAVRSEDPEDLALGDLEADAVDRLQAAVSLAQVADGDDRPELMARGMLVRTRAARRRAATVCCGDRRPAELLHRAASTRGSHRARAVRVGHQRVDRGGQVARKPIRVGWAHRLIRANSTGTSSPVSPSTTTSGIPPTAVATTGVSQAIASRLVIPNGS